MPWRAAIICSKTTRAPWLFLWDETICHHLQGKWKWEISLTFLLMLWSLKQVSCSIIRQYFKRSSLLPQFWTWLSRRFHSCSLDKISLFCQWNVCICSKLITKLNSKREWKNVVSYCSVLVGAICDLCNKMYAVFVILLALKHRKMKTRTPRCSCTATFFGHYALKFIQYL